jgi:hypothetical protein
LDVWYDSDRDGIQDAAERGVPGVVVKLLDDNGTVVMTTTTDASGYYLFENLTAGNYSLEFVPPSGYNISPQDVGDERQRPECQRRGSRQRRRPGDGPYRGDKPAGWGDDRTWELGSYLDEPPAAIGDRVWFDTDRDGVQDVGERGVSGVTVQLLNASGAVVATAVTDQQGNYLFENLPPGNYAVQFVPPAG